MCGQTLLELILPTQSIWLTADMTTTAAEAEVGMGTGMTGMMTETGGMTVMMTEAMIAMMTTVVVRAFACFISAFQLMFSHVQAACLPHTVSFHISHFDSPVTGRLDRHVY